MPHAVVEHQAIWTHEQSARFWDFASRHPEFQRLYFSRLKGAAILDFAKRHGVRMDKRVLDFGCGPGHLIDLMLKRGVNVEAVDFSPESVEQVQSRFKSHSKFNGVELVHSIPTSLKSNAYVTIMLIETVEHLLDEDLDSTLGELFRLAVPGGMVVVTTPHDEDLIAMEVMCPECACRFHRMQHVRNWQTDTLTLRMEQHGFETVVSRGVYFITSGSLYDRTRALAFRLLGKKMPHLAYIGRKPVSPKA